MVFPNDDTGYRHTVFGALVYDGYAADVWACGVLLFRLTTGALPFFTNGSKEDLAQSILQDEATASGVST